MKRLVLHLGYPKTGTTLLQSEVFPRAAGSDLAYLGVAAAGANQTDNRYLRWRREVTGLQPRRYLHRGDLATLVGSHHLIGSPTGTLVISDELLLTVPLHAALVGRRDSDRGRSLARTLERLRDAIPEGIDLEVLLTLRRQEDLVPAFVAQEAHRVSSRQIRRLGHALEVLQHDRSTLRRLFSFDSVSRLVREVLKPASVTLLPLELLDVDRGAYRRALEALIGAVSDESLAPVLNSRRSTENEWQTSYGPVSSLVHRAYASLPLPLPPEWMKRRSRLSSTPQPRRAPPVVRRSEADRILLRQLFAESNRRCEELNGLGLAALGYATIQED